jgi:hypothetical protein
LKCIPNSLSLSVLSASSASLRFSPVSRRER